MPIAVRTTIAAALLASVCSCAPPPKQTTDSVGAQPAARDQTADTSILDRVTTLETLFPQVSDRALYEAKEPATEAGQRSYTFALKPQPGMDPARHFQIVTVTWTLVREGAKAEVDAPALAGTGGPNGSFMERTEHTRDQRYTVRVALGELLPNTARTAAVDIAQIADRLVDRYGKLEPGKP